MKHLQKITKEERTKFIVRSSDAAKKEKMETLLKIIDTTNTENILGMRKTPISARIEQKILEDSKAVAKKENRSFNNLLETALIAYCKGKL